MMNILALSLVVTTLLTACVHSPNPQVKDVIVKEGHRVVMVEFDEEGDTNTKVSISTNDEASGQFGASVKGKISDVVEDAKVKLKNVPNLGQGVQDSAADKANQASDLAKDAASDVKSRMSKLFSAVWMTKETVTEKGKQASDVAGNAAMNTKSRIEGGAKDAAGMAKQGAKETVEMARRGIEAVEEAIDTTTRLKVDVEKNSAKKMDKIRRHGRPILHSMIRSLRSNMRILQLFGFATAYGMSMWVTFMSNYVLARVLPIKQFASAQRKIYPIYFKAMACSIGLCFLGHLISEWKFRKFVSMENFQGLNLVLTLGMILANLLYFEPRVTKVMFERLKDEKEEGRGLHDSPAATIITTTTTKATEASPTTEKTTKETETTEATPGTPIARAAAAVSAAEAGPLKIIELSETLKKMNACSSYVNVLTLMGLTLHLVHLGQCLGITC